MRLIAPTLIIAASLLAAVRSASATSANDPCSLPQSLQREVMNKYPGTRLVTLRDLADDDRQLFEKDHENECPSVVRVDFYGDGKPTFALVLIPTTGTKVDAELVVAHNVTQKWETVLLDKAKSSIPVVWRQDPGEYKDIYGDKKIRARKPVIVFCGYNAWVILYAWTGRRVDKLWLRD